MQTFKLKYKNRNPWINNELRNDIKLRDNLFQMKRKNPTPENIANYKKHKNENLSRQRKAEREYYRDQFEIHKNDLKKSWNIIKDIIGKENKHTSKKHTTFLINNHYITDTQTIANSYNDYFINVGSTLAKNIISDIDPLSYVLHNETCIHIPEINIHEIISIVSSLSNGAAGYDEIPASVMKQHVELDAKPPTFLINLSKFPVNFS